MNVLFIAKHFWPSFGAAASVNTEIARGLSNRRHRVTLLLPNAVFTEMTYNESQQNPPSWCKVRRFGPRLPGLPGLTISFLILLLRAVPLALGTDIILCEHHHSHLASLCAAIASVITRRPLVIRVHDVLVPRPESAIQSGVNFIMKCSTLWSFRRARTIFVPGDELVKVCRQTYGLRADILDVSHNGVDVGKFTFRNRSDKLRRRVNSNHIVIFSALLSQGKGLEVLFQAASLVRQEVPDLRVLITGDGPDLPRLRRLVIDSGLSDCVRFTGAVHPGIFPTYVASADVGIGELHQDCTNYGSTPLKIIEYMASGCVALTARGAVSKSLIHNGINGLLCVSGDHEDVAKSLLLVLADKRRADQIRKRARLTVETEFSWNVVVFTLERKLLDILKNRN